MAVQTQEVEATAGGQGNSNWPDDPSVSRSSEAPGSTQSLN